jgi:hypothetical protein
MNYPIVTNYICDVNRIEVKKNWITHTNYFSQYFYILFKYTDNYINNFCFETDFLKINYEKNNKIKIISDETFNMFVQNIKHEIIKKIFIYYEKELEKNNIQSQQLVDYITELKKNNQNYYLNNNSINVNLKKIEKLIIHQTKKKGGEILEFNNIDQIQLDEILKREYGYIKYNDKSDIFIECKFILDIHVLIMFDKEIKICFSAKQMEFKYNKTNSNSVINNKIITYDENLFGKSNIISLDI